jgi:hypothetical protein
MRLLTPRDVVFWATPEFPTPMLGWLKNRVREAPPGQVTRDLWGDGWHIQLDLSPQVLSLAIRSRALA